MILIQRWKVYIEEDCESFFLIQKHCQFNICRLNCDYFSLEIYTGERRCLKKTYPHSNICNGFVWILSLHRDRQSRNMHLNAFYRDTHTTT